MTVAERREIRDIVAEGYRRAEAMLANYREPPTMTETIALWFADLRGMLFSRN